MYFQSKLLGLQFDWPRIVANLDMTATRFNGRIRTTAKTDYKMSIFCSGEKRDAYTAYMAPSHEIKQFALTLLGRAAVYQLGNTSSRTMTEVKQHQAWLVLA